MNDGTERPVFLIPSSSPPLQGNKIERPSFLKVTLDNTTSHPSMSQPVTISYDSLTSDKLPPNQNLASASKPSLHSATALESVQILSKKIWWGGGELWKRTMMKSSHQSLSSTIQVCQRALRRRESRRSR